MAKFTPNGAKTYIEVIKSSSPVPVTSISAADPAVVSVGLTQIGKFNNGDVVTVAGASGDFAVANGEQRIGGINTGAGTFNLMDVDTTAATGGVFTSTTVTPQVGASQFDIQTLSNESPAIMTLATADVANFSPGDMVKIMDTGTELDGKVFMAGTAVGDDIPLLGSDLTGLGAPVVGEGRASPVKELVQFCLSSYEYAIEAADEIDVSTFCGTENLAGTPTPGTISIETFQDYERQGYNEWRRAIRDGIPRVFHVVLPDKAKSGVAAPGSPGGDIMMVITPSGQTESWAVNEAASFSGEAVVNSDPTYLVKEAA